jgi:23S rRNA pseudouridine2605 synthase
MSERPRRKRKPPARKSQGATAEEQGERLQKVLAGAGLGSRRKCEELILAGRVEVDREVVTELGTRVDPGRAEIRVDGVRLPRPKRVYYALNKPAGVVCTNRDPSGRPRAIDLIATKDERLFTVGRLDLHSEGLILATNDGELANRLTHPRYEIRKTYRVVVAGHQSPEILARLRRGIHLAEGVAQVASARIKRRDKRSTVLEIVLKEGRNREIRRVLARVGHKVLRLVRIGIGPLRLGALPAGAYRRLSRQEIDALRRAVRGAVRR